jgi:hypothetical protein
VKHPDRDRMVRLRGQWVQVDPRHWDATMDVSVNVALGQGSHEERAALLSGVYQTQVEQYQAGSPLVSLVHIRNTLASLLELGGFKNSERFYAKWGPAEQQQFEAMQQQQQAPPDPNMMLVQIEAGRVQAELQIKQQELELKRWEVQMKEDRERDKLARESALKEKELELKHQADIIDIELKRKIEADRDRMDADIARQQTPTSEAA